MLPCTDVVGVYEEAEDELLSAMPANDEEDSEALDEESNADRDESKAVDE